MTFWEFAGLSFSLLEEYSTTIPALAIFVSGLLLLILMLWYHFKYRRSRSATIMYSDVKIFKRAGRTSKQKFRFLLTAFQIAALVLLI